MLINAKHMIIIVIIQLNWISIVIQSLIGGFHILNPKYVLLISLHWLIIQWLMLIGLLKIQTPKSNTAKSSTQTKSGFTIKIKKKYISKNKSEKSNQSSQSTKTNATNESRTNNNNNKSSRKRKHHDSNSKINDSPRKKPKLNNGKSKSNTTPSSNTISIATQLSDSGILSYYFPFHIINLWTYRW